MTVRDSNIKYVDVVAAPPLHEVGWYARVLSERDYATVIAEVRRFESLGFTVEANAEGGGQITLDADDRLFTDALPLGETTSLANQEAIWQVIEDGTIRAEFFAEDIDQDVIAEKGDKRTTVIAGRGAATVLEWAKALPEGWPVAGGATTRTFDGPPMAAWLTLLEEAQALEFVPWVVPMFTAEADSGGELWESSVTLEISAGEDLLSLLKRYADAYDLRWRMLPGFRLQVFQSGGRHLEDKVAFTAYRYQEQHKRRMTRRDVANVIFASGSDVIAYAESEASQAKWHKRMSWLSAGGSGDATAASAVANTSLAMKQSQQESRIVSIPPSEPGRKPFDDFVEHDWIGLEVLDEDAGLEPVRVAALAVDVNDDGPKVEITLQTRMEARAITLQRLLDKLGASTVGGSGTAPIPVTATMATLNLTQLADVTGGVPGSGEVALIYDRDTGRWTPTRLDSLSASDYGLTIGTNLDRRWTAGAGETSYDEFSNGTLEAAWTRVDKTGGASRATWTEGADSLSAIAAGGDSSQELHALIRPLSGMGGTINAGDAFVTCLTVFGNPGDFVTGGLVFADGTTSGAGKQVLALAYTTSSQVKVETRSFTNYLVQASASSALNANWAAPVFVRLVYLGSNNWRTDTSPNGVGWLTGATLSYTFTPTHAGLLTSSWGTSTAGVTSYEFIRRVSGIS